MNNLLELYLDFYWILKPLLTNQEFNNFTKMFFKKKKDKAKRKLDSLATWLIIWGAVAWIIGLSKTEKWKKITKSLWQETKKSFFKNSQYFLKNHSFNIRYYK